MYAGYNYSSLHNKIILTTEDDSVITSVCQIEVAKQAMYSILLQYNPMIAKVSVKN